jgi:predicted component of type VI protein secretion system
MKPLSHLENLIAEIMERPAWLLSSRKLHPLELSAALSRALEERALRLADRVVAPDDYTIKLNPTDLAAYGDATAVLERELAGHPARLIVERDLTSARAPLVRLTSSENVRAGRVEVEARFSAPEEAPTIVGRGARRHAPTPATAAASPVRAATAPSTAPRTAALLLLAADGTARTTYSLAAGALTLGRRSSAEIVLADAKVSRDHARVERAGDGFVVEDLGSLNGTLLNGEHLSGRSPLRDGDTLTIGHSTFRFVAGR